MSTLEDRMRDRARRSALSKAQGRYVRASRSGIGGRMSAGVSRTPRTVAKAKKNTFSQLQTYLSEYRKRMK